MTEEGLSHPLIPRLANKLTARGGMPEHPALVHPLRSATQRQTFPRAV